jgi:hypothetical protein
VGRARSRSLGGGEDRVHRPLIAIRGLLADDPKRLAALERELLDFAERSNTGSEEAAEYEYGYLLVVATMGV